MIMLSSCEVDFVASRSIMLYGRYVRILLQELLKELVKFVYEDTTATILIAEEERMRAGSARQMEVHFKKWRTACEI